MDNQLAAGAALVIHVSGQLQLPHAVNITVCVGRFDDAPCIAVKESELDEGGKMEQGG